MHCKILDVLKVLEITFLDVLGFGANSCGDLRGIMRLDGIGDDFHSRLGDSNPSRGAILGDADDTLRNDTTRFTSLKLP